jgi:hypothetical protein
MSNLLNAEYNKYCLIFRQILIGTHPLLFPLSAKAKRGIALIISNLLPLLWFTREGGWGDEYMFKPSPFHATFLDLRRL